MRKNDEVTMRLTCGGKVLMTRTMSESQHVRMMEDLKRLASSEKGFPLTDATGPEGPVNYRPGVIFE
ncbi:MAG: hypothetical protein WA908_02215 [Pontixanthobacter sp.]